jgi:hypothetical protein
VRDLLLPFPWRRFAALALIFGAAITAAQAQETDSLQLGPPATLVVLGDLSAPAAEARIGDILFQRVVELATGRSYDVRATPTIITGTDSAGAIDLSDVRISQLLAGLPLEEIELVVAVFFRTERSTLLIQFALFDPDRTTILGGVLTRARTGLTLFTTVERAVAELAPILDQYLITRAIQRPDLDTIDSIAMQGTQEDVLISFAGIAALMSGGIGGHATAPIDTNG